MAQGRLRGDCGAVKAGAAHGDKGLAEFYGRWHVSPESARIPPR
jgi:hypothetical protein